MLDSHCDSHIALEIHLLTNFFSINQYFYFFRQATCRIDELKGSYSFLSLSKDVTKASAQGTNELGLRSCQLVLQSYSKPVSYPWLSSLGVRHIAYPKDPLPYFSSHFVANFTVNNRTTNVDEALLLHSLNFKETSLYANYRIDDDYPKAQLSGNNLGIHFIEVLRNVFWIK